VAINSYYVRNMLRSYDRQLVTARRLARYRRVMRAADASDALSISREARRNQLVERVAKEVVENLLISGSDNPIVARIRDQLERECKETYLFEYPVTEPELLVFRQTKAGPVELEPEQKQDVLNRLWKITLDTVDETML